MSSIKSSEAFLPMFFLLVFSRTSSIKSSELFLGFSFLMDFLVIEFPFEKFGKIFLTDFISSDVLIFGRLNILGISIFVFLFFNPKVFKMSGIFGARFVSFFILKEDKTLSFFPYFLVPIPDKIKTASRTITT